MHFYFIHKTKYKSKLSLSITWKLYAPIHCCNLLLIWPGCDCIPGIGTLFWQGFGILGIWYLHINWGPSVYSIVVGTSAPTLLLFVSSSSVWVSINIICACDAWKWRHSKVLHKIFIENVNNTKLKINYSILVDLTSRQPEPSQATS